MKVTILGCGTSTGVPVPACNCSVCLSDDPKNNRLRASIWVQTDNNSFVIDTSPDFRAQSLRAKIKRIDAVLLTHAHADHILGLDDIRSYNFSQKAPIPFYATQTTWDGVYKTFEYVFNPDPNYQGGGLAKIECRKFLPFEEISFNNDKITTFQLMHGKMEVIGFRFKNFAYATDCNLIPEQSYASLKNLDVLILDALREEAHATHFTIEQAIEVGKKIGAKRTIFTHYTHAVDFHQKSKELPAGFELAYDGMEINL